MWCYIISALPWPACLQATYLLCCSVQENIVSPLKVGTRLWEGQRESGSTKNVRLEKKKWLWHRYGQKIQERQTRMETRKKRRLKQGREVEKWGNRVNLRRRSVPILNMLHLGQLQIVILMRRLLGKLTWLLLSRKFYWIITSSNLSVNDHFALSCCSTPVPPSSHQSPQGPGSTLMYHSLSLPKGFGYLC